MSVQRAMLSGQRLHLQHGPIDLVIGAEGAREAAFEAASAAFEGVLQRLVDELDLLRAPWRADAAPDGPVARAMWGAVGRHAGFVTPMAAVAGAVADHVLGAMRATPGLRRAYVNNGGDIALWLGRGERFRLAIAGAPARIEIASGDGIGGVATSGFGGRSLSLGIAESVTVLARDAAHADAAATLIANAVDLPGHGAITRVPAQEMRPDSDLGARLVVAHVGDLSQDEVARALARGAETARGMQAAGLIRAAALVLRGQVQTVGTEEFIGMRENAHA
ncbi:UPF0280 family protein [Rhodalgimonas zhirmunskyi]|uniref:UPF0280 family protein n=1 Tax=Rhodalgimonas zhirmunskyi TaxID=2964767 RepID=A0AAJ1UBH7_9RHOB|nr:UPF0280 family protein [Rhodoalgimonas zhirmunskyi]MDQ2094768.1 UPF0280 family protein [Rhodoalgimonas zhirmunskyi]